MIELIAVFFITANISSAAACSEFWMISSVIGSLTLFSMALSSAELDVNVVVAVDLDPVAGMDDDGAAGILDDGGTGKAHARRQPAAVIDRRLVNAFERIVDLALALQRGLGGRACRFSLAHGQLADFGRSHQVDADHFDRRVEPVGVLALVGLVERALDRGQPLLSHRAA